MGNCSVARVVYSLGSVKPLVLTTLVFVLAAHAVRPCASSTHLSPQQSTSSDTHAIAGRVNRLGSHDRALVVVLRKDAESGLLRVKY